ncbi:MAG: hypothetical protein IJH09_06420 [Clostridia bacterium]|nr:hypothetical protein [Clostridia bacterium]
MAKKSAKSKGYRRQTAKKAYLSKRDIALLCVLVVALAIGAFFLFRYDDGALKVRGGSVVTEGDNWLIVNGSNTRGRARYFKLGEMGEIDGYAREAKSISTDANIPEYAFEPEASGGASSITVTTSHSEPDNLAKYAVAMLGEMEGTDIGEIQTAEMGGQKVTYFTYTSEYYAADESAADTASEPAGTDEAAPAESEAEAEPAAENKAETAEADAEPAPNRFSKVLSGYFSATHDSCIAVHVETEAPSADDYCSDEDLAMLLEKAVSAVTLEEE